MSDNPLNDPNVIAFEQRVRRAQEGPQPLQTGGGGSNDGGMIGERIAKLEVQVGHIDQSINGLRGDLSGMRSEMREDRRWIIGTVLATGLGVAGLIYALNASIVSSYQAGLANMTATFQAGLSVIQAAPKTTDPPVQPSPAPMRFTPTPDQEQSKNMVREPKLEAQPYIELKRPQ